MNDSLVRCSVCQREARVSFATCLRRGWPKCCHGYTMTLVATDSPIEVVVGELVRESVAAALSPERA